MSYCRDIGGYFGLEMREGREFYPDSVKLNSACNALCYLIQSYKIKKIWVPYYTCPDVRDAAEQAGCRVHFYHIDENFMPAADFGNDYFIYTNYFGICMKNVRALARRFRHMIVDNAQAFYAPPEGFASFNSVRKFFGVPDGSYLFCRKTSSDILLQDSSACRCSHLLKRPDTGAASGYADFQANEKKLADTPVLQMSELTRKILSGIDYEFVRKRRLQNFKYLHRALAETNRLQIKLGPDDVPMVYPYLCENGQKLRQKLIENHVYCATYWKELPADFPESRLRDNLIPLPLDQRYSKEEMKKILLLILDGKVPQTRLAKLWNLLYRRPCRALWKGLCAGFVGLKRFFITRHQTVRTKLLLLDNYEPATTFLGFRVSELNWILKDTDESMLLMFSDLFFLHKRKKILKFLNWDLELSWASFCKRRNSYAAHYHISKDKLRYYNGETYHADGAYFLFLCNAYIARDFLEKYKIPFAFTLLPGGNFRLNNHFSDHMLKSVLSSPMFRGCFCPQKIIYDYLIQKNYCSADKLYYSYGGGFAQTDVRSIVPKVKYPEQKKTFDISFVAFRYMPKGLDKGFDLILDTARVLIKKYPFIHFHIVGTNTLRDFEDNYKDIRKNLHFYGFQHPSFFPKYYSRMDISLSPNRPNMLMKGSFDGFPLQSESCLYGVALFCTDELHMNDVFVDGRDIVIIKPSVQSIVSKIEYYLDKMDQLYAIGRNGQRHLKKYFNLSYQKKDRAFFIKKYLGIDVQV